MWVTSTWRVAHRAKAANSTLVTAVGMPTMVAAWMTAAVRCAVAMPHPAPEVVEVSL